MQLELGELRLSVVGRDAVEDVLPGVVDRGVPGEVPGDLDVGLRGIRVQVGALRVDGRTDLACVAGDKRDDRDLSVLPCPPTPRLCPWPLAGLPPIHVSSATTRPKSSPASGSRFMASRTR